MRSIELGSLLIYFSLVFFTGHTQTLEGDLKNKNEVETIKKIEAYLLDLEKVGFSGSVLVEINNLKVISNGYGFRDKEKHIKNSSNTVFDIGSITKQFTAAAILKLEMQGKLSTSDKISKFFENIPGDKKEITIHDLLRHQSGLIGNVGKDYEEITESDFLDKVFSSKLRFEIGSQFSYSNVGYSLLAMIIEKTSGQTYEEFLYGQLWQPAQMELTGYTRPTFDTDLIAVGYNRDNSIWGKPTDKEWDKFAPYWHLKGNGGILSTTEDLYKWHTSLMTELILSKEANKNYITLNLDRRKQKDPIMPMDGMFLKQQETLNRCGITVPIEFCTPTF